MRLGRHLTRISRFGALLLSAMLFAAAPAFAKKVSVEWKEIKGAAGYEIQIERNGKIVVRRHLDDTSWSGKLDFGVYDYQIRAYDKVKRPGAWSSTHPLVVMPSPPELVSPDGGKITFYGRESKVTLKWKEVPGVTQYVVELTSDDKSIIKETVEGTQFEVKHLTPGSYAWQVTAIVQATGRTPSSLTGRKWESKASSKNSFNMVQDKLEAPDLIGPKGDIKPPIDGKVDFRWSKVTGAEAYEVRIIELQPKGRAPAGDSVMTSSTNTLRATLSTEGRYRWEVRALASIETVDEKKVADATSPTSQAEFNMDRNATFFDGGGYVALSTMLAPYTYDIRPGSGFVPKQPVSSSAITTRVSGEVWLKPQWGVAAGYDHTSFEVNSQSYSHGDLELDLKYRTNVSRDKYAWALTPKVGFLHRDYPFVIGVPNGNGSVSTTSFGVGTLGPVAGFDLRKQMSEKFSLGMKFAYYLPLSASDATLESSAANKRNFGVGVQALYWLNKRWGLGAGVLVENRSISVQTSSRPAPDVLYMDGSYFFGSILYSWGR